MNKKMILPFVAILVLAVAMVGAASADEVTTVDTIEVRGNVVELTADDPLTPVAENLLTVSTTSTDPDPLAPGYIWDYSTFAGFWYDLDDNLQSETLKILVTDPAVPGTGPTLNYVGDERTIEEDCLIYHTSPVPQQYELNENEGLTVESNNVGGDTDYWMEGWMAEEYLAIDNNADKLCKLLVEFEDDDKKTLSTGEEWDLGSGFSLTANQIDLEGDKVWFTLKKDGKELDSEVIATDSTNQKRVYTYTADLAQEEEIPVFSCYVDAVFRGTDSNIVQIMYVFLMDDDVLEIDSSDTFGVMEVMKASAGEVILRNNEDTIDLDIDTTEHIMGDMYFKTADNAPTDLDIRFYLFVEYTIGEGVTPGEAEEEVETPTEVETPEANVTPTEVVMPTPEPTVAPEEVAAAEETAAPEETATPKTPGFEAIFAIAGLLAVAYLVLRQRE